MCKRNFDCSNYGDVVYREDVLYCYDCEECTFHQLAYYKGDKEDKVRFCTQCGKTYSYNFDTK